MAQTGENSHSSGGRSPPCPKLNPDNTNYEIWRKQVQVWRHITSSHKRNQGSILFLAMEGKAKDHVHNMDLDKLEQDDGFEEVLKVLDEVYLPEIFEKKHRNFNDLWFAYRKENESMAIWVANWHAKFINYEKVAGIIPSETAALMLLTSARLTAEQKQSIKLHMGTEITYAKMRELIKIKFGAEDETKESYDMFFNHQEYRRRDEPQDYDRNRVLWNKGYKNKDRSYYKPRPRETYNRPSPRDRFQRPNKRWREDNNEDDNEEDNDDGYRRRYMNPMRNGKRTTCNYCGSKYHYRSSYSDYTKMLRDRRSEVKDEKKFTYNY